MSLHYSFALPFPPSVNRLWRTRRRADGGKPQFYLDARYATWKRAADNEIMALRPRPRIEGHFTISVTLNEDKRRGDADNRLKAVLDTLQRAGVIEDDKLADQVSVRWGWAPEGCRVDIRPAVRSTVQQARAA